ncbi:MAG: GNAT family N-acetyltransferase [Chloroflexota bacterium]|nr:GNAT family N-acetyltransferase [Chloroflexota bacterium]
MHQSSHASEPQPLTKQVAADLRLPWTSLLSREELSRHVGRYPRMSWHVPGTQSYLVAGPWRNRSDVVEVLETRGERHRSSLWQCLLDDRAESYGAVLVDPAEYRSATGFYRDAGVVLLEEVLVLRTTALPGPLVEQTIEMQPMRNRGIDDLMRIDRDAFPWLWWNSREEFEEYLDTPGVTMWVALRNDEVLGYVGITQLREWGHIDRLAVRPRFQGNGYGTQLLAWALQRLDAAGARYAQLSTQESNQRSRGLYQQFGFRPTRGSYKLYGLVLKIPASGGGTSA